jgi:hypothetical protein
MDGVLADMKAALRHHAIELFGADQTPRPSSASVDDADVPAPTQRDDEVPGSEPVVSPLELTSREQQLLWRHVRGVEGFWETLDEIEPGAVARLQALAQERRWEVIFLTKRPPTAGATAQVQSQRWLQSRGFLLPSVYVVSGNRGLIASALELDAVVDDTPDNCVDVANDSKALAIGVFRDADAAVPFDASQLRIQIVRSVDDAMALLCELEREGANSSSAFRRMLKTIGSRLKLGAR